MNDYSNRSVNMKLPSVTVAELNNNSEHLLDGIYRPRSESRASTLSSASSSNETSEEMEIPEVPEHSAKEDANEVPDKRRFRSMSDGSPTLIVSDDPFEVFPSLPDSVLEKMGLLGDCPKERLNEEESEQKFVGLALAFSIDATTIKDRCQRQRRYRDQTEKNLNVELDRLMDKAYRMQPLCVDAETAELLTDLLTQVNLVMRASAHAAISAERFGAVQHEDRLAQAVELMIKHVTLLKQQRDSARKHLQYTKRMLQNTNNLNESQTLPKAKNMHSRRASIANINHPSSTPKVNNSDPKRIARRTSEMFIRIPALPRHSRPSRLELGVDLVKIREVTPEGATASPSEDAVYDDQKLDQEKHDPSSVEDKEPADISALSFRQRISYKLTQISEKTSDKYKQWCDSGTIHEMFTIATLVCFSLSIITLCNILIELESARCDSILSEHWTFNKLWNHFSPILPNYYDKRDITS